MSVRGKGMKAWAIVYPSGRIGISPDGRLRTFSTKKQALYYKRVTLGFTQVEIIRVEIRAVKKRDGAR